MKKNDGDSLDTGILLEAVLALGLSSGASQRFVFGLFASTTPVQLKDEWHWAPTAVETRSKLS